MGINGCSSLILINSNNCAHGPLLLWFVAGSYQPPSRISFKLTSLVLGQSYYASTNDLAEGRPTHGVIVRDSLSWPFIRTLYNYRFVASQIYRDHSRYGLSQWEMTLHFMLVCPLQVWVVLYRMSVVFIESEINQKQLYHPLATGTVNNVREIYWK